ncbi:MAG: MFS transporter [Neisseriaceae bacterium]|nr:MAG: MFS transporter [Neisseriaceae bacterium]
MIRVRGKYTDNSKTAALYIWILAASFYGYEFLLRVFPGIIQTELMQALDLDVSSLGLIFSIYYWGYASMQIPGGVILDKIGPRITLTLAALICSSAIIIFGYAQNSVFTGIARFLIGFGSAFALIGTLKLIGEWFPLRMFAFYSGLTYAFGTVSASLAGGPCIYIVDFIGWRQSCFLLGVIGLINTFFLWFVVRNSPSNQPIYLTNKLDLNQDVEHLTQLRHKLKYIIWNPQSWIVGICIALMYIPVVCFGEIWGIPYLMKLCSCSKEQAGGPMALIFIGIAIGAPLFGYISAHVENRKYLLYFGNTSVFFIMSTIICVTELPLSLISFLMFILGIFLGPIIILFAFIKENNPKLVSSTAVGFANSICMIIPGIFQYFIGVLLKLLNPSSILKAETASSFFSFKVAFLIFPISSILACLCLIFIKANTTIPSFQYKNKRKIYHSNDLRY